MVDTIKRPRDYLVLAVKARGADGRPAEVFRPWMITMPRATAAITLRARIIAALGVRTENFAMAILGADEEVASQRERMGKAAVDEGGAWRPAAVRLLRNARAGRAIRGLAGGSIAAIEASKTKDAPPSLIREPVVGMREAAETLRVVASGAGLLGEGNLSDERARALFGRVEAGALVEAGLLWELAFACRMTFHGPGADALDSPWAQVTGLLDTGGALEWAREMDGLIYPDEAHVLWTWCLLHTFRPF